MLPVFEENFQDIQHHGKLAEQHNSVPLETTKQHNRLTTRKLRITNYTNTSLYFDFIPTLSKLKRLSWNESPRAGFSEDAVTSISAASIHLLSAH